MLRTWSLEMIEMRHLSRGYWLEGLVLDNDDTNVVCRSENITDVKDIFVKLSCLFLKLFWWSQNLLYMIIRLHYY